MLCPPASFQLTQERGIKLFEIFSKEARVERRRKLKEDMQHGYFDDFRAVRDQHGKIFSSPERLIDAQAAQPFPSTQMVRPDGLQCTMPPPPGQHQAALLCTAFRAGAEDILASWSTPFKERYGSQQGAHYFELSFVESAVMSVWPFKQIILRAQLSKAPIPSPKQATLSPAAHASHAGSSTPGSAKTSTMQTDFLFHFGDTTQIRKALEMPNRLTGYAFLIDSNGLVRWRGSGLAEQSEVDGLLRAADQLLK
ncbi:hypothetical protein WJX79_002815 [Trebouxia sp. C0005]